MEKRSHSPFGNRARREPSERVAPDGGPVEAPAPSSAPSPELENPENPENPEKERRRLEALASLKTLKGGEERREKQRTVTGAVIVLLCLVAVVMLVRFVHTTVRTAQFNNARTAFLSAVKRSNSANPHEGRLGIFGSSKQLFDRVVQNDSGNPEAYLYASVIALYIYEGARNQSGDRADRGALTEAHHHLDEAFKRRSGYPEAHYYAAVVCCFNGDRKGALASLLRCPDSLDRMYGASSANAREWKEQVEVARKKIESAPEGETPPIEVRPPHCMLSGIEIAK